MYVYILFKTYWNEHNPILTVVLIEYLHKYYGIFIISITEQ